MGFDGNLKEIEKVGANHHKRTAEADGRSLFSIIGMKPCGLFGLKGRLFVSEHFCLL
jgi:hypothetical protein